MRLELGGELAEVRSREADEAENRGGLCAPGCRVTRRLELTTIAAPPPLYSGFRRQEAGSYTVCRLSTPVKMFKKGFVSELYGSSIRRTANSRAQILRVTKDQAEVLSPAFAADKDLRAVPAPSPPYRRNHPQKISARSDQSVNIPPTYSLETGLTHSSPERIALYSLDHEVLFFQHHDDALFPHLRLVHRFPQCFPTLQIDRGAIRFVLSGAQLMCPGLTSPGAKLPDAENNVAAGVVVVINAEGKSNACMVGLLKMDTEKIKLVGRGVGVETVHYLGDGLWRCDSD